MTGTQDIAVKIVIQKAPRSDLDETSSEASSDIDSCDSSSVISDVEVLAVTAKVRRADVLSDDELKSRKRWAMYIDNLHWDDEHKTFVTRDS